MNPSFQYSLIPILQMRHFIIPGGWHKPIMLMDNDVLQKLRKFQQPRFDNTGQLGYYFSISNKIKAKVFFSPRGLDRQCTS
jgi:hypothetical protein